MANDHPTKLLVFGANGMLGHVLCEEARARGLDVFGTMRRIPEGHENLFEKDRILLGVEAEHEETVIRALQRVRPDFAVNCIGIVKQSPTINDPIRSIKVNSLFPHALARGCADVDSRLIHMSTDCVFSGSKGHYKESDQPDPADFYGLSKLTGEPKGKNVLVLRTSMFGLELSTSNGLLEWFIAQRGRTVHGFVNSIFSGLYTRSLARLVLQIAFDCPSISGVRHLSAEAISKCELLERIRDKCHLNIEIVPDPTVRLNRSLDSSLLRRECDLNIPSWEEMINRVAEDLMEGRK
jgi:dTDP-4-dehydrorhamnose reductase